MAIAIWHTITINVRDTTSTPPLLVKGSRDPFMRSERQPTVVAAL